MNPIQIPNDGGKKVNILGIPMVIRVHGRDTGAANTVTAVAITKGSISAASTLTLVKEIMKTMAWSKIKLVTAICAGVIVMVSVSTVMIAQPKGSGTSATDGVATNESLLITPGVSGGKVKVGMTEDDVTAALGQPERKQGEVLIYDNRFGLSVVCSRQKIVGAVFCGDASGRPNSALIKAFTARTKEGIGMGSSKADIVKAYGKTSDSTPLPPGKQNLPGRETMVYKKLGLTFA